MASKELLALARSVLEKHSPEKWDSRWDPHGTSSKTVSQKSNSLGTLKSADYQSKSLLVPMSHPIGDGTAGHAPDSGTAVGALAGQSPYSASLTALKSRCPQAVDLERWQQAIKDADAFLASWGRRAAALGWTARDLFSLAGVPDRPAANYQRLSRYDQMGLIWIQQGRRVVALTEDTAKITTATGSVSYRRPAAHPALAEVLA